MIQASLLLGKQSIAKGEEEKSKPKIATFKVNNKFKSLVFIWHSYFKFSLMHILYMGE